MSSNKKQCDTHLWDKNRHSIRSSKGGWVMGKGVYCHGYDMMEELVGHKSYMQVLILNATGRMVSTELGKWMDAANICLSWPDPRIWCNQIGALGGAVRASAVAATVSGVLAADSRAYGSKPLVAGVQFIQQALQAYKTGKTVEEIVQAECARNGGKPYIMGFARPIAKGDERIPAMQRVARKLGFVDGEHLALSYQIEQVLLREFDEGMNINGYGSAFLADEGFTAEEVYRIFLNTVTSGVTACYVDTVNKPADSFLALRCDDIAYEGKPHRDVPARS